MLCSHWAHVAAGQVPTNPQPIFESLRPEVNGGGGACMRAYVCVCALVYMHFYFDKAQPLAGV